MKQASSKDLINRFSKFRRETSGGVLPFIAIGFIAISAATAISIDIGKLYLVKNALQTTADFAAIAAADRKMATGSTTEVENIVMQTANANLPTAHYGNTIVANQIEYGTWDDSTASFSVGQPDSSNAIRVTASRSRQAANPVITSFGAFFGMPDAEVSATSVALLQPLAPLCILQLNSAASVGIDVWGSAEVIADDCAVHANSTSGTSIKAGTNALLQSASTCAVGGYSGTGYSPNPAIGCDPVADPLGSLPTSASGTPAHSRLEVSPGIFELAPGDHSDFGEANVTINSGETYILQPGEHFFYSLTVMGGGTIQGTDVVIAVGGSSGPALDIKGGSIVQLSGRQSGTYAGLAIMGAWWHSNSDARISGDSTFSIDGTVYFRSGHVEFTGNSTAEVTMLVADTIAFTGNAAFQRRPQNTVVPIPANFDSGTTGPGTIRLAY